MSPHLNKALHHYGISVWNGNTAKDFGGFQFIRCLTLLCSFQPRGCFYVCTPKAATSSWVRCPQPGPRVPAPGMGCPRGAGHTGQLRDHCCVLPLRQMCPTGDQEHPCACKWVKKDFELLWWAHPAEGNFSAWQKEWSQKEQTPPYCCMTDVSDQPSPLGRAATD